MSTTKSSKATGRTIYLVTGAGYAEGYTGRDHLLPDHHSGMVDRQYGSLGEVQAELDRRTDPGSSAPGYAHVKTIEIPDAAIRDAWADAAIKHHYDYSKASVCKNKAENALASDAYVDVRLGKVMVDHRPANCGVHRNEIIVTVGDLPSFVRDETTLRA